MRGIDAAVRRRSGCRVPPLATIGLALLSARCSARDGQAQPGASSRRLDGRRRSGCPSTCGWWRCRSRASVCSASRRSTRAGGPASRGFRPEFRIPAGAAWSSGRRRARRRASRSSMVAGASSSAATARRARVGETALVRPVGRPPLLGPSPRPSASTFSAATPRVMPLGLGLDRARRRRRGGSSSRTVSDAEVEEVAAGLPGARRDHATWTSPTRARRSP